MGEQLRAKYELLKAKAILKARSGLLPFVQLTKPDYEAQWFHGEICQVLDRLERGELKKVMIFVPPQHGKSQISSRHFPAYALGRNPDRKIALCSYGADHAQSFNRDVQRMIDSEIYNGVFPRTTLNASNVATTSKSGYKRTANIFEVVDHTGFLKTVGVGGALTGTTVDIGIIDDPFKDREEAQSGRIREKVWNWYTDVFETRLHNDSQQLMLFTRWHEDDLAGRALQRDGIVEEGGEWVVIKFPAIREPGYHVSDYVNDPRKPGEALWPERHAAEKYFKMKDTSPRTYWSLAQQEPAPMSGNILKREDLRVVTISQVPKGALKATKHFVADTAYTKNTDNDPSAVLCYSVFQNQIYLWDYIRFWRELSEAVTEIEEFVSEWGDSKSRLYIEPKASGLSIYQEIRKSSLLNVSKYKLQDGDKVARLNGVEPKIATGRVNILKGQWNEQFIGECLVFPNGKHDEAVDTLVMAITQGLVRGSRRRGRRTTSG